MGQEVGQASVYQRIGWYSVAFPESIYPCRLYRSVSDQFSQLWGELSFFSSRSLRYCQNEIPTLRHVSSRLTKVSRLRRSASLRVPRLIFILCGSAVTTQRSCHFHAMAGWLPVPFASTRLIDPCSGRGPICPSLRERSALYSQNVMK
jgi:hypothetical protein